jgi:ABC-type lipopolysaccharide export system ATPase subunit
MLTVSQLSKSFAGRALFDDVSLQVNREALKGLGPFFLHFERADESRLR